MSMNPAEQTVIKPLGMFRFHRGGDENTDGESNGEKGVYKDVGGRMGGGLYHGEKEHLIGLCISLAVIWHQHIEVFVHEAHAPCVQAIFAHSLIQPILSIILFLT